MIWLTNPFQNFGLEVNIKPKFVQFGQPGNDINSEMKASGIWKERAEHASS